MDSNEIGGSALLVGFLGVLLVLYRDPVSGWATATGGVATVAYFLVLPVAGLLAGVYAIADGPYSVVPQFLLGSYLGVVGLGLLLAGAVGATPIWLLGSGVAFLLLSLGALVASVLESTASVHLGLLHHPGG
jgi:hypothetical protein